MVRAAASITFWLNRWLKCPPFLSGRRDPQLAFQFMINKAKNKQGFDFDDTNSGAANAVLGMALKSLAEAEVERLLAFLFVSADPLALALSAYEVLKTESHRTRFTDPFAADEMLGAARFLGRVMEGIIYVMGKVKIEQDKTLLIAPLKDMLELQCVYTPQRQISNLELALDMRRETVLSSGEVQQISNDRWFKRVPFFGKDRPLEKWARDLVTSPAMLFATEFSSYLLFLFLLSSLQPQAQHHTRDLCRDRPEWRDSIRTNQGCSAWFLPVDSGRIDKIERGFL